MLNDYKLKFVENHWELNNLFFKKIPV